MLPTNRDTLSLLNTNTSNRDTLSPLKTKRSKDDDPIEDFRGTLAHQYKYQLKAQAGIGRERILRGLSQAAEKGDYHAITAQIDILLNSELRKTAARAAVKIVDRAIKHDNERTNEYQRSEALNIPAFIFFLAKEQDDKILNNRVFHFLESTKSSIDNKLNHHAEKKRRFEEENELSIAIQKDKELLKEKHIKLGELTNILRENDINPNKFNKLNPFKVHFNITVKNYHKTIKEYNKLNCSIKEQEKEYMEDKERIDTLGRKIEKERKQLDRIKQAYESNHTTIFADLCSKINVKTERYDTSELPGQVNYVDPPTKDPLTKDPPTTTRPQPIAPSSPPKKKKKTNFLQRFFAGAKSKWSNAKRGWNRMFSGLSWSAFPQVIANLFGRRSDEVANSMERKEKPKPVDVKPIETIHGESGKDTRQITQTNTSPGPFPQVQSRRIKTYLSSDQ